MIYENSAASSSLKLPVKEPTNVVAVTTPTVILGLPDKPYAVAAAVAVDAVPVNAPLNVVAVTIPTFCIFLLSSITVVPETLIAIVVVNYSAFTFI